MMSFGIYSLLGIRGQLHVIVKVDLFTDSNKFRQSSCGVRFFCCKYSVCVFLSFVCVIRNDVVIMTSSMLYLVK